MFRRRIEIKYALLGVIFTGALVQLSRSHALAGLEDEIMKLLDITTGMGLLGIFAGAVITSSTPVVNVPYTLLVLTFALANGNMQHLIALSIAAGTGTSTGKVISYTFTSNIAGQIEPLSKSPLYRRIKRTIARYPRGVPLFIFLGNASPLPSDMILLPLALIHYPIRRMLLPLYAGKILHSLSLVLLCTGAVDLLGKRITPHIKIDLTFGLLVISALVIFYQIEKAMQAERESEGAHPAAL